MLCTEVLFVVSSPTAKPEQDKAAGDGKETSNNSADAKIGNNKEAQVEPHGEKSENEKPGHARNKRDNEKSSGNKGTNEQSPDGNGPNGKDDVQGPEKGQHAPNIMSPIGKAVQQVTHGLYFSFFLITIKSMLNFSNILFSPYIVSKSFIKSWIFYENVILFFPGMIALNIFFAVIPSNLSIHYN